MTNSYDPNESDGPVRAPIISPCAESLGLVSKMTSSSSSVLITGPKLTVEMMETYRLLLLGHVSVGANNKPGTKCLFCFRASSWREHHQSVLSGLSQQQLSSFPLVHTGLLPVLRILHLVFSFRTERSSKTLLLINFIPVVLYRFALRLRAPYFYSWAALE